MKKNITYSLPTLLLAIVLLSSLNSCVNTKKLTYFNNIVRDSTSVIPINKLETVIANNDILSINISTPDATTTSILNSQFAINESQGQGGVNGYLVDEKGVIKIPLIGAIKAAGFTKNQLAASIASAILSKKVAIDPIVNIRIVNFKVTVLGEVTHPGVFPAPNERMTLPEALGMAGDLSVYGKRNNVLLIREVEGKRIYKRFSLNDDQLFDPEIYNLKNQDIIYIEPNNARAATGDRATQVLPILLSTVSLLLVIYTQFIR
jgi:polysaccharide export outer membrane protein